MDASHLLARIIGPYLIVVGLGLFINRKGYKEVIEHYPEQPVLILTIGAVAFILGLLMLQFHNIWTADWRVLITLIGWITLIKGASALLAPQLLMKIASFYKANDTLLSLQAVIAVLFGAYITYMGFIA